MAEIKFIPFTEFAPDRRLIGGDVLHEAKNAVPLFGQYRLVNKLSSVGSQASTEPPTGSHSQLIVEEVTVQYARPDADVDEGGFFSSSENADLYTDIDEESPNDGDFIQGNASAESCRFSLSDVDDPSSSTGHIIRFRYRIENATASSAYDIDAELIENVGGVENIRATATESGTTDANGVVDWTEAEYTLTALEADSITDYSNLRLKFNINTLTGPVQEVRPIETVSAGSWTRQNGSGSSLFSAIDESVVDDADYIQSKVLASGQQDVVRFKLTKPVDPLVKFTHDETFRFRVRCSQDDCQLKLKILSGTEAILTPGSDYITEPAGNNFSQVEIQAGEFTKSLLDYDNDLFVEFQASFPQNGAYSETSFVSPNNSDNILLSWSDGVDTTDVHEAVDETVASDVDFITSLATNSEIDLDFPSFTDPLTDNGFIINVRARVGAGPGSSLQAELYSGSTRVGVTTNPTLTGAFTTFALPVTAIRPFGTTNLSVKLTTNGAGVDVSYVALEYPTPPRVDVSFLEYETISLARAKFSWAEFEVPSTVTEFIPDRESFFVGTTDSIYKFDGTTFEDVSIAGGYGTGSFQPLAWNFVQWGNDVIATNYVDPVQILEEAETDFADLITSTETPKARFVTVINNHLVLANINHNSHFPDEVWWSGIDDATDFDPDITTGSDFQRLLPTPGGITGIIGGAEFGYVFKENSVYRMNYVGYPQVFTFHVIAHEGTKYSKSIVRVGNDVYFFGSGGFRKLDVAGNIIPIGDLKITKFLTDSEFEDNSIFSPGISTEAQTQNSIIGWYDRISRLITWAYRGPGDSVHRLNHCIVYNPVEDRWGRIEDTLNIAASGSVLNNSLEDNFIHRGAYIFTWDGNDIRFSRFSSSTTYEAEVETSIISIEPGSNVTLLFIRPVWTPHLKSGVLPNLEISVSAGEEPTLTGVRSSILTYEEANSDGWIPCAFNGEFFKFTMTVPELSGQNSKEFSGLQLKLSPEYSQQRF